MSSTSVVRFWTITAFWLLPVGQFLARAEDEYRRTIAPLFQQYCVDCHGNQEPEGQLDLTAVDIDFLRGNDLETWRMIEEQLRFNDMPPKDAHPLPSIDRKKVLDWVGVQLRATQMPGAMADRKLLLPQFGNYVDHKFLFDHRQDRVIPAAPRIWRLRPQIYNSLMPRLAERVSGLANALNTQDGAGFKDYSAPYFLDEASTQQLLGNAKKIAEQLVSKQSKDRVLRELVSDSGAPDKQTVLTAISILFRKALGRAPKPPEREAFYGLYKKSVSIGGYRTAAKALITAVLLRPEFMFRQELGSGKPDPYGRVRLTQREISYALSYALSDMPLAEFIDAAEEGNLATKQQVAEAVRKRLVDDSAYYNRNPRVFQFIREYFNYGFATEVFKDQPDGGEYKASSLVADLEFTIKDILKEDQQVFARLLTTRNYYVNTTFGRKKDANKMVKRNSKSRKYQTSFNLPLDWKWGAHLQPIQFRNSDRAGVLTHPAWLAAWSGNFDNHPVQRGKWIRTHLLGGTVADVPIGVDARVPEKEHATFRQRLSAATAAPECWRCHRKMDPLGVVFERYDHYGRLQRFDAGQSVDTSGRISRTAFPELHRKVSGPTEMMDFLAKSERVEQVFVRHVFRFMMGRNETLGDANTLQDAHRAYRESDGSLNELLASILSSDSFLLRQLPITTKGAR